MTDTECLDNARYKCDNNKDCYGIAWFPSNPKQPLRLCESPKTVPKEDGWRVIMKSTTMPKGTCITFFLKFKSQIFVVQKN